jgi:hypothetical protein
MIAVYITLWSLLFASPLSVPDRAFLPCLLTSCAQVTYHIMESGCMFADYVRYLDRILQGTKIVQRDAVLFMDGERYIGGTAAFMKFVRKKCKGSIDKVRDMHCLGCAPPKSSDFFSNWCFKLKVLLRLCKQA